MPAIRGLTKYIKKPFDLGKRIGIHSALESQILATLRDESDFCDDILLMKIIVTKTLNLIVIMEIEITSFTKKIVHLIISLEKRNKSSRRRKCFNFNGKKDTIIPRLCETLTRRAG